MKLWVTKYALTKGIYQADFVDCDGYWREDRIGSDRLFLKKQPMYACATLDEAKRIASEMASKKIRSLEKQITKLRQMQREPKVEMK